MLSLTIMQQSFQAISRWFAQILQFCRYIKLRKFSEPAHVQLLALKPAEVGRGWIVRVQESAGKPATLKARWLKRSVNLGKIAPRAIQSFRLVQRDGTWVASPVSTDERNL